MFATVCRRIVGAESRENGSHAPWPPVQAEMSDANRLPSLPPTPTVTRSVPGSTASICGRVPASPVPFCRTSCVVAPAQLTSTNDFGSSLRASRDGQLWSDRRQNSALSRRSDSPGPAVNESPIATYVSTGGRSTVGAGFAAVGVLVGSGSLGADEQPASRAIDTKAPAIRAENDMEMTLSGLW